MPLPTPVAHFPSRVAPPQDDQEKVLLGGKLHLVTSFAWSYGSGLHSKLRVNWKSPLKQAHNSGNFYFCRRLLAWRKKGKLSSKGFIGVWSSLDRTFISDCVICFWPWFTAWWARFTWFHLQKPVYFSLSDWQPIRAANWIKLLCPRGLGGSQCNNQSQAMFWLCHSDCWQRV